MHCCKCGKYYDSEAVTCPFCGYLNFVERIPETVEKNGSEDFYVAQKTRSIPMFINVSDRYIRNVLRVEKIMAAGLVLVLLFILAALPLHGVMVRFINRNGLLDEFASLYQREQFAQLSDRMYDTGCFGKKDFEQYTDMTLLYRAYMDFCGARIAYQTDIADGELERWTVTDLACAMRAVFSSMVLVNEKVPDHPGNDAFREQYRNDVLVFAEAVLLLTDEELTSLQIINCYDIEDVLEKAIGEMRK
jgi:hypothetical protein